MSDTKRCTDCKTDLPISEFNKNKSEKDGHTHVCKSCRKTRSKTRYEGNKTTILEKNAARRIANPESSRIASRECKRRSREANRKTSGICQRCGSLFAFQKYKHNKYCEPCKILNQNERIKAYYEANKERVDSWNKAYRATPDGAARRRMDYENYVVRHHDHLAAMRRKKLEKLREDENYVAARLTASLKHRSGRGDLAKEHLLHLYAWQEGCCYHCSREIKKGARNLDHIVPISLGGSSNPYNIALACKECNSKLKRGYLLHSEWAPENAHCDHTLVSTLQKHSVDGVTILSSFWASTRYMELEDLKQRVSELQGVVVYDYDWLCHKEDVLAFAETSKLSDYPWAEFCVSPEKIHSTHDIENADFFDESVEINLLNRINGRYTIYRKMHPFIT